MYLTEAKLVEFCKENFQGSEFQFNKRLNEIQELNFRPDVYIADKKIIVEFDGYLHYTKASTIVSDYIKDQLCKDYGIRVIRIPYFVQLSTQSIQHYFQDLLDVIEFEQIYPHGFIDKKAVSPADFCSLGVDRFLNELSSLPEEITNQIINSMFERVFLENKIWEEVFPYNDVFDGIREVHL